LTIRSFIIFLFILAFLNPAIAQTKSKSKTSENPTFMQKVYHDMTTRFNYFFNARLKLNQSLQQIQASNKDNYDELLPVRVYGDKEKRSSMSPAMDEVVKKSSIAIQLHKISKWVDDCYLLLAKANYFKGDYESSIDALRYIDAEFSTRIRNTDAIETEYDKELKKRGDNKPEDEKGKSKARKDEEARRNNRDTERENALREREIEKEKRAKKREIEKEKKEKKKNQEASRKDVAKERDAAKKEKEKEKKERIKEREKEAKERAKERDKKSSKDYNKEKAKAAKERNKGQSAKDYNKAKAKAAKERAKGKKPTKKEQEKIDKVYDELEAQENVEQKEKDNTDETLEEVKEEEEEVKKKSSKADKQKEKEAEEAAKLEKENSKKAKKEAKKKRKNEEQDLEDDTKTNSDFSGKSSNDNAFGHKLVGEEAQLWLAENYMEMGSQQSAMAILDRISENNSLPKKLREQYFTLKAIYAIDNELWTDGAEALKLAIKHSRKRSKKARYYFILAQINKLQENYGAATASFKKVLKNRPIYDMEFNTRLKMAQTLMLSDPGSKKIAIKSLKKMLKDEKNEDYTDQIHFALAEVELADGNIAGAIESLKESAASSTTNKNQKGQSFLKLAEIYFNQKEYQNSAAFYDSAMVFISKDLENYEEIEERKETLVKLASYLYSVELEDSLQQLANLPEAVRNDIIDQKIDEIIDAATQANTEVEQGTDFSDLTDLKENTSAAPSFNSQGQAFYFYNESSKGKGFTNFKSRWGNRNLNDWWALASKAGDGSNDTFGAPPTANFTEAENELQALALEGQLNRAVFIAQLPLDEESLKASNDKIIEGLYQSGNIYKENLQKNEEAKTAYTRLLSDYPKNPYDLETNYELYLLYKSENNTALSNKHKQYILDNYPDSNYAQIIGNPNYAATLNAVDDEINDHYKEVYDLFKREAYQQVIEKSEAIDINYAVNPLKHKFDFLTAQAIGYTQEETAYVSALENVISNYPGTDVEEASKNILTAIKSKPEEGKGVEKPKPEGDTSKYKTNLDEKHFVLVHYPQKTADIKIVQNEISLFNDEFFSLEKYKVNDNLIDNKNHILVVRTFKNGKDAVTYYNRLRQEASAALGKANAPYSLFVISKTNFTIYLTSIRSGNETAVYTSFFENTYLNQ